jgi:triosephosphate isomerase
MATRTRILAGNWKMNLGPQEAKEYFNAISRELGARRPQENARWVVFPPAYALSADIQDAAKRAHIELGAQNVHSEEKGAYTGELSGGALKSMGINWVLIGHSERRQYFAETDETATARFKRAALTGLNIIYCIGERLQERETGQTEAVLTRQLGPFVEALREQIAKPTCPWPKTLSWSVAYEPVWAIGTGKTATTEQAEQAHRHIRKVVWDSLGIDAAQHLPILYGGSVTPENAQNLLAQPNIDGVLVGGASLKPDGFARILASL